MRDLGIAGRLRAAGLVVEEQGGWQSRGSDAGFNPVGVMWHHTASAKGRDAPSLGIVTNGRADLAGPLCHVLITRSNKCIVISSGKANHAGTGAWGGVSNMGNASKYGIEVENTGYNSTEPWPLGQIFVTAKATAALIGYDMGRVLQCCHHKEYTSRKIDMHTISGDSMRSLTIQFIKDYRGIATPTPPSRTPVRISVPRVIPTRPSSPSSTIGIDLAAIAAGIQRATQQVIRRGSRGEAVKWAQALLNNKLDGKDLSVDGIFGPATDAATRRFQSNIKSFFSLNDTQMPIDGIIGPLTWFWLTK
jgi:hypothetical protein